MDVQEKKVLGPEDEELDQWDIPFERMSFDDDHCFLCGSEMGDTGTEEHVFPKWLQRRFNLWDNHLTLLNRTHIPYRQLTVPCCGRCNNDGLSQVENEIRTALDQGFPSFRALDPLTVFKWCGKVFWGILFKELSLPVDRADPEKGFITSPDLLRQLSNLHGFLQSVYRPVEFLSPRPFSVLVVNLHDLPGDSFDFTDNLFQFIVGFRLGSVGVIVSLEDDGIAEGSYRRYLEEVGGRKLHPIQFNEVLAKVIYDRGRLGRIPRYMFVIPKDLETPFQVVPMSSHVSLDPFDNEVLAQVLEVFWRKWGYSFDFIYQDGMVRSHMVDEKGDLAFLGPEGELVGTASQGDRG